MMDQAVSTGVARYTTAHKLSVLRAQDAKVHTVLRRLQEQPISRPKEQNKSELIKTIKQKLEALKEVSEFFSQQEQLQLIKDTETFLSIARFDPGLDEVQCLSWVQNLGSSLERTATQSRLAVLFCDVLQQWLDTDGRKGSEPKDQPKPQPARQELQHTDESSFANLATDLQQFLEARGLSSKGFEQLHEIQKQTTEFGEDTLKGAIKPDEVAYAMKRLSSDPRWRTEEVREELTEEANKPMALEELASAFTFSLKNIAEWEWPSEGILSRKQTHINGKEREALEMDVEISIFLELIAVRWINHFKPQLSSLRESDAWPKSTVLDPALSKISRESIFKYLFIDPGSDNSISTHQLAQWDAGLPITGMSKLYTERQEVEPLQILDRGMTTAYEVGEDDSDTGDSSREGESAGLDHGWNAPARAARTARAYSDVFQMLCADIKLLQAVSPGMDITAVHLDVKDFGPSMSHAVSIAIFEFFGAPLIWLKWLRTYLEIPIRDADGCIEKSQKGTPFGQGFSTLVNELLLIVLDLAVATRTSIPIHRNHDDFWFWSQDQEKIIQAWTVMQDFAKLTGLEWNEQKSGCRVVSRDVQATPASLPQTPFRWGYLLLERTGEWTVDESLLDACVQDAKAEIHSVTSMLGKINVWNKYQAFLLRNTSMPLMANGPEHLERLQNMIGQVQVRVTDGESILECFKKELRRTFSNMGSPDIPDAMYYWPLDLGGFELHSQLITIQTYIDKMRAADARLTFQHRIRATSRDHRERKEKWQSPYMLKSLQKASYWSDRYDISRWAGELAKTYDQQNWPEGSSGGMSVPFLTEAEFLLCEAATNFLWDMAYDFERTDISGDIDAAAYSKATRGLYNSSLTAVLGQATCIVPADLVPKYALHDLQRTVKHLYK
jgi:hypothetical protein